jgi:hypothetical protein
MPAIAHGVGNAEPSQGYCGSASIRSDHQADPLARLPVEVNGLSPGYPDGGLPGATFGSRRGCSAEVSDRSVGGRAGGLADRLDRMAKQFERMVAGGHPMTGKPLGRMLEQVIDLNDLCFLSRCG